MRLFYEDELITLLHGDCHEAFPLAEPIGLLVLDPPFDEWAAVARWEARTVLAFTNHKNRDAVTALYGRPRTEIIWHFDNGRWVSHNLPRITHETILLYGESGESYVGEQTNGRPENKGSGSVGRDTYATRTYRPRERKALDSVLHFPRDLSTPVGVWLKPLGLMYRLIEWAGEGLVFDPYCGAGTTLLAAKQLGLRAIGIEREEWACEVVAGRLAQENLFSEATR